MAAYLDLEWLRKENFVKIFINCRVPEEHWYQPCPSRTALDLSCCLAGKEVCAYFLAKRQDKAEMKCEFSCRNKSANWDQARSCRDHGLFYQSAKG